MRPPRFLRWPSRSRDAIGRDIDAEIEFHVDARADELIASGLHPGDARRRARAEFGDIDRTRTYCLDLDERTERAVRTSDRLADLVQDVRWAVRTMRRAPGFALLSLLTIALAIGANTAIFSAVRAVLLKPLPYGDPSALVALYATLDGHEGERYPISPPDYIDYRDAQRTLRGLAAYTPTTLTWRPAAGEPEIVRAVNATANVFDVLDVRPEAGRTFVEGDDAPGATPRVVVSHGFWLRALGGDPGAIGRSILLNDRPHYVIGVMPARLTLGADEEMWVPLDLSEDLAVPERSRKQHWLRVIARVDDGVPFASARADLGAIAQRLEAAHPDADAGRNALLVPLRDAMTGDLRRPLLLLQGAAVLVLLIACANLANLALSRATGRRREMSVRAALGGGRGRIVRQLLTESVVLAVAGGAIGVLLALVGVRLLLALNPDTLPGMFAVGIDARVLMFCVALSIGTGVLFGIVPAIDAARADLGGSLRDGGRGASGGRHGERVRRTLVIAQIGLAVTLLVGAGLLVESFGALTRVRLGFEPGGVLTAQLGIGGERYASADAVNRFYDRVLDGTARAPGVVAVGAAIAAPTLGRATSTIGIEGEPFDAASPPEVGYIIIRGDYFEAMRIPLLAGRAFDATDTADGPRTVILNEAAARRFFPAGDAVGRRIRLGPDESGPWTTIIGVAGDIRDEALDIEAKPSAYVNHRQETWFRSLSVVVRTSREPMTAAPALRRAVRDADPTLAVRAVRTLDDVLGSSLAPRRFALGLASCFAIVALLLAAIGIYGVLAYTVTQRTREFGVRLALGATPRGILGGVVRQGLVWSLPGLALGLAGALAGVRLIAGMLYGVEPLDPRTWLFVTAGMLVVVCVACLVPAARATRVDPLASMRAE